MEDGSIDVAIIIGVLEWAGESMRNMSPLDAQLKLLAEIKRLLRKGGRVVVGIENRYGYKYLRGKRGSLGCQVHERDAKVSHECIHEGKVQHPIQNVHLLGVWLSETVHESCWFQRDGDICYCA